MKLLKIGTILLLLLTLLSCVSDDDFKVPDLAVTAPEIDGAIITIAALANTYEQAVLQEADDLGIDTNEEEALENLRRNFRLDLTDTAQYIEGFVINSDASGNWFEELIVQDKASNPTRGLRVLIDESPLFTFYEVGRKVFVKLNGLHIGVSNGVLSLGVTDNLEKIPAPLLFEFVLRSTEVADITPLSTTIANFTDTQENLFIELTDVQFIKSQVIDASQTFAGEPLDEFDGERTLVHCGSNRTVILSTSTFANFKSVALPKGRGSVRGTLSRNFFGDEYNLVINHPSDITFEDIERCDPIEIDCGLAETSGNTPLFVADFEDQTNNQPISGNGWTNFIEAGTEAWEAYIQSGQNASIGISARVGSFLSGDNANIAWLITPQIDLASNEMGTLEFLTSNSFADGSRLEVLFSSDWNGEPDTIVTATWDTLSAAFIVEEDDFFGDFFSSGLVDLSCIQTAGYIAFKYSGSGDANFDGTFELEGVEIFAQ